MGLSAQVQFFILLHETCNLSHFLQCFFVIIHWLVFGMTASLTMLFHIEIYFSAV